MAVQSPEDTITIAMEPNGGAMSLVVCSLEPWGDVKRRIGILVDEIVDLEPSLHVLYVAPPVDVLHLMRRGTLTGVRAPRLERVHPRIHVLRPRKWWPRLFGGMADRSLERQVLDAVGEIGLLRPLLWINDAAYAPLTVRTGWPSVYDITDDWLLASMTPRQRDRLVANEDMLFAEAGAVVVCSPELERTRSRIRPVELIPNGVDVDLFRTPRSRPADLTRSPVALYVGTLHAERVDIPLVMALAEARPDLHIVLLGPNSLPADATNQMERVPTIHLLGPRPYGQIPAYLQHADVVIVPHLVNPFTESLDPIKAYECLAAGRPTVATPVAGFRGLGAPIVVAEPDRFVEATMAALDGTGSPGQPGATDPATIPTWHQRAETMVSLMKRVRRDAALR